MNNQEETTITLTAMSLSQLIENMGIYGFSINKFKRSPIRICGRWIAEVYL